MSSAHMALDAGNSPAVEKAGAGVDGAAVKGYSTSVGTRSAPLAELAEHKACYKHSAHTSIVCRCVAGAGHRRMDWVGCWVQDRLRIEHSSDNPVGVVGWRV